MCGAEVLSFNSNKVFFTKPFFMQHSSERPRQCKESIAHPNESAILGVAVRHIHVNRLVGNVP